MDAETADFVPETPEPEEHQYASAPSYKHVEQPLHSASTAEFDADGDEYHDGAGESEWAVYNEDETLRVDGDGREMSLDLDVKPEPSPVDIGQEIYRETAKPEPPQKLSANVSTLREFAIRLNGGYRQFRIHRRRRQPRLQATSGSTCMIHLMRHPRPSSNVLRP